MILKNKYCEDCKYFFKNEESPVDGYCQYYTKQTWVGHPANEDCYIEKENKDV